MVTINKMIDQISISKPMLTMIVLNNIERYILGECGEPQMIPHPSHPSTNKCVVTSSFLSSDMNNINVINQLYFTVLFNTFSYIHQTPIEFGGVFLCEAMFFIRK